MRILGKCEHSMFFFSVISGISEIFDVMIVMVKIKNMSNSNKVMAPLSIGGHSFNDTFSFRFKVVGSIGYYRFSSICIPAA